MEVTKELITGRDIEKRIKSKAAVIEFFERKRGLLYPQESVFNTKFFLQVLKGIKKLLPLSASSEIQLGRLKNIDSFNRESLFNLVKSRRDMSIYIPDDCSYERIDRNTILKVRFHLFF